MELQIGVKAIIKNKQNQILMLKRAVPSEINKDYYWDLPGGRLRPEETIHDALTREIMEETGMKMIGDPHIIFSQDIFIDNKQRHVVRLTYIVDTIGTEIVIDKQEHTEYKWVNLDEVKNITFDKYLEPIIKLLIHS